MNITIVGTHFKVDDEFRMFVTEKLENAFRGLGDTRLDAVTVYIELERTPARRRKGNLFRAEANVTLPRTTKIRVEEVSDSMTKAVVQMKHTLARELREWRERLITEKRRHARPDAIEPDVEPAEDESEAELIE